MGAMLIGYYTGNYGFAPNEKWSKSFLLFDLQQLLDYILS